MKSAFPVVLATNAKDEGMTLRDYFAAKALHAILCNQEAVPSSDSDDAIANRAYFFADAMLNARG
jgi:hypothetical protein